MKLKNYDIYNYALKINQELEQNNGEIDFDVPIIINFYIQKNIEEILKLAGIIEKSRNFIIKKYKDDKEQIDKEHIKIKDEFIFEAQKDLDELMNIEQDANIVKIKLSDLKDCNNLTTKQLKMILFMIDDDLILQNNKEPKED